MGRINIEQGSPEWKALRATKISATMASSILGLNPYKSIFQLFAELTGLQEEPPPNEKMLRGAEMEAEAREKFIEMTGNVVKPAVFVSDTHHFAMCSLDGIADDGTLAIEIKCGAKAYKDLLKGVIAPYYMAQMQHQMWVCNLQTIIYCCYDGKKLNDQFVERDQEFIDRMIVKEEAFYRDWQNLVPPTIQTNIWDTPYDDYLEQCDKFCSAIQADLNKET